MGEGEGEWQHGQTAPPLPISLLTKLLKRHPSPPWPTYHRKQPNQLTWKEMPYAGGLSSSAPIMVKVLPDPVGP